MKKFLKDELGAVKKVDWVVVTAAIVGLGIAYFMQLGGENDVPNPAHSSISTSE